MCTQKHAHTYSTPAQMEREERKAQWFQAPCSFLLGHIGWRPQTLLYQSKAGASGYEAFLSDLAHQDTLVLLGSIGI